MFTGIVEEIGSLADRRLGPTANRLTIAASTVLEGTRIGDSISADGVCLTVAAVTGAAFTCDVMPETLRRSTLGRLARGSLINLERAVAYGGRVGGHYVQGHVDGIGLVRTVTGEGPALIVRIAAEPDLLRYIVSKGFIAVDGASLTVVDAGTDDFSVSLVYHTQQHITLAQRRPGDPVNIEVDIIGKYVERFVAAAQPAQSLTREFL
ncbi:MAG: riboflavin synthase, partial [Chloroflexi bacterium]|nr:riboflavin synthase [Chloroflexota bacterium]